MLKFIKIILGIAIGVYISSLAYVMSFSLNKSIPDHADAALILGAKVNLDESPSEPLYNRTMVAVNLYKSGKIDYIIGTGGVGLGRSPEAEVARKIAVHEGVPKESFLLEINSHNTFASLEEIKNVAEKNNIKSIIVISDQYHVARGVLFARHFGFYPVYWDYPEISYYRRSEIVRNYLREATAIIAYAPTLWLHK